MNLSMMGLSGTMMIVAVIIIRLCGMHRLPKQAFIVLWGMVLCRLLVPFSFPAKFSVFTFIHSLKPSINQPILFNETETYTATILTKQANAATDIIFATEPVMSQATAGGLTLTPLIAVWLAGMVVTALFFIISYYRFKSKFKQAIPLQNKNIDAYIQSFNLKRKVTVLQSDTLASPLTYGVLRPVIVLPNGMDKYSMETLKYVLAHELTHIKHFDQIKKFLMVFVLCVYWFNTFVWVMYILFNRDIEIACDENVVRMFGMPFKALYAGTLINMEEQKIKFVPLYSGFSKYAIEERIGAIMKMKKRNLGGLILALALVLGTTAVFATSRLKDEGINDSILATTKTEIITDDDGNAHAITVGEVPAEWIDRGGWITDDSNFPRGLVRVYGRVFASALRHVDEYGGYFLEEPIALGDALQLTAIFFTDYELTLYFSNLLLYEKELGSIIVTGTDGVAYSIGGYDDKIASFFQQEDHSYIFYPTSTITLQLAGETYEVQLAQIPQEYHYGSEWWINYWEENVKR